MRLDITGGAGSEERLGRGTAAADSPQHLLHVLVAEGVDDGVDAAVRHPQGLCHLHGLVQLTAALTVTFRQSGLEIDAEPLYSIQY